jgi:hypothetical protein
MVVPRSLVSFLAIAGGVVGLVTGLVTMGGWLVPDASAKDVFDAVVPFSGLAWCLSLQLYLVWVGRRSGLLLPVVSVLTIPLIVRAFVQDDSTFESVGWFAMLMIPVGAFFLSREIDRRHDEATSKLCPMCAERVKKNAQICRFCGHSFDVPVRP